MKNRNIIVIGGSAGALPALSSVLEHLPTSLPAVVAVVLHLQPSSESWLAARLSRVARMPVVQPESGAPLRAGCVYTAPPDMHLLLGESELCLSRGPRENLWRPAIDVLFRSAAITHRARAIGVLLSGNLDDGTAGLQAIKACGGIVVVQDPADAEFAQMPRVALANVPVDHCLAASQIGEMLCRLTAEPAGESPPVPPELAQQVAIAKGDGDFGLSSFARGDLTHLSCPECGGPLWKNKYSERLRCLVGHSFGLRSLLHGAEEEIDRSLWAAIRLFEQRMHLTRQLAQQEAAQGRERRAALYSRRAEESRQHAVNLKELQMARRNGAATDDAEDVS